MSSIRQYQRRALESLKPEKTDDFIVCPDDQYFLNFQKIYLLGISKGIGTCSDLHGVNIAVFGSQTTLPELRWHPKPGEKIECSWSALLREPSSEEKQRSSLSNSIFSLAVEGLEVLRQKKEKKSNLIYFTPTGKIEVYCQTIC